MELFAKEMKVKLTLIDEMLGTASGNPELHAEFIAAKALKEKGEEAYEEEVEAVSVDEMIDKAMTGFSRNEAGIPILWDYQIRGFFKESCAALKKIPESASASLSAHKKKIDLNIFVKERQIPLNFKGFLGNCQRPLRAQTMKGERVALANSETVPAGTTLEFTILLMDGDDEARVREWLDYGRFHGLGQWRNASKGRFEWELIDLKVNRESAPAKKRGRKAKSEAEESA